MLTRARGRWLLVLCAATLIVTGCSDDGSGDGPAASGAASGSPAPTAPATGYGATTPAAATPSAATTTGAPATAPAGEPSVAVSSAPPVKVGSVARVSDSVKVKVGAVRDVTVKAEQPGEIAGPAAAVQVTVANEGSKPFSLDGMVVTASYGDGRPGDQTSAGPSKPLTGSLAAGKVASGTYVFMVPRKDAASLRLAVSSNQSPVIVQFDR